MSRQCEGDEEHMLQKQPTPGLPISDADLQEAWQQLCSSEPELLKLPAISLPAAISRSRRGLSIPRWLWRWEMGPKSGLLRRLSANETPGDSEFRGGRMIDTADNSYLLALHGPKVRYREHSRGFALLTMSGQQLPETTCQMLTGAKLRLSDILDHAGQPFYLDANPLVRRVDNRNGDGETKVRFDLEIAFRVEHWAQLLVTDDNRLLGLSAVSGGPADERLYEEIAEFLRRGHSLVQAQLGEQR